MSSISQKALCRPDATDRTSRSAVLLAALLLTLMAAALFILAVVLEVPATASPNLGADGEAIARRYYTAINAAVRTGDLSLLDAVAAITEGSQESDVVGAGCDLRCRVAALHRLAPEVQLVIDELVADQDRIAVRLHVNGADRTRFLCLPLTGDLVPWETADFLRIADGRVAEPLPGDGPPTAIQPLARAEIEAIPRAPYRLGLIRLTLAPGTSLPGLSAAGPVVLLVESGTLGVHTDLPVAIRQPRATDMQSAKARPWGSSKSPLVTNWCLPPTRATSSTTPRTSPPSSWRPSFWRVTEQ